MSILYYNWFLIFHWKHVLDFSPGKFFKLILFLSREKYFDLNVSCDES